MKLRWAIYRSLEIYQKQGFIALIREVERYTGYKLKKILEYLPTWNKKYMDKRIDNEFRWNLIKKYICSSQTFLDIGCAEGFFVNKTSNIGVQSLGVDQSELRLSKAQEKYGFKLNSGFAHWDVSPKNIGNLPNFNIISFQTVSHHVHSEHGYEGVKTILRAIATKCDLLIYEAPGNLLLGEEDIVLNVRNCSSGEIIHLSQSSSGRGLKLMPKLHNMLETGEYEVVAESDRYGKSNAINITVGKSGKLIKPGLWIQIKDNKIELLRKGDTKIDFSLQYTINQMKNILGDDAVILEKTVTNYKSNNYRKDPFLIIDVSKISV